MRPGKLYDIGLKKTTLLFDVVDQKPSLLLISICTINDHITILLSLVLYSIRQIKRSHRDMFS
jgi:hypothetical protein